MWLRKPIHPPLAPYQIPETVNEGVVWEQRVGVQVTCSPHPAAPSDAKPISENGHDTAPL